MIVFRYIFKETLKTQLSILFVLLLIFTSQQFIRILDKVSEGTMPASIIGKMMLLNIPYMGLLLLPASLYVAILFAHGRLYADSEITVLKAVGVGPAYIMKVSLILSGLTAGVCAFNSIYLAPTSQEMQSELLDEAKANPLSIPLDQGKFLTLDGGKFVAYVENIKNDGKTFSHIFVLQRDKDMAKNAVIVSQTGHLTVDADGTQWVTLGDGRRYAGIPTQSDFVISEFSEYKAQLQKKTIEPATRKTGAYSSADIMNSHHTKEQAEWQWRIALPLSIPILTLIAVPMAVVNPRQGRFARVFPAILLYFSYFLLLSALRSAVEKGQVPTTPGLYILPLLYFVCFAIPMNIKTTKLWQHIRLTLKKG